VPAVGAAQRRVAALSHHGLVQRLRHRAVAEEEGHLHAVHVVAEGAEPDLGAPAAVAHRQPLEVDGVVGVEHDLLREGRDVNSRVRLACQVKVVGGELHHPTAAGRQPLV
jgi:hypothetical protein